MNIKHIKIFIYIIFFLSISFIFSFSDTTGVVNENKQSVISVLSPEDSSKALEALRHEIEGILSNKAIQSSRFGLSIYSLDSKKYIYNKNIDNLLTPASTTKLFTSFTALTAFGADFEIKTNVVTDGQISKDGELKGNIFIIGHGDPMLSVADIENLADQISSLGIKKITGNIYGDASYFDGISSRRIYSGDRDEVQATPPVTALCIENNIATTLVTSGSKDGESVKVQIIPESDAFAKQINAKVRGVSTRKNFKKSKKSRKFLPHQELKKKARKKISLKDIIEINDFTEIINKSAEQKSEIIDYGWGGAAMRKKARMTRPKSSKGGIRIQSTEDKSGKQLFIVSGSLAPNRSYSYRYYINRPELVVAGLLKDRLKSGGIHISGGFGVKSTAGIPNEKLTEIAVFSRKITDLLYPINKNSDNWFAEQLFKINGAQHGSHEDNAAGARQLLFAQLVKYGIPCDGCVINDGSGLSRRNKVTPEALLGILRTIQRLNFASIFDSTLSIASIDGTLHKRMSNTAAEDNLIAKTGTLSNASSLAGYVKSSDGEHFVFAIISNGGNVGFYKRTENQIGAALADFSYHKNLNDILQKNK